MFSVRRPSQSAVDGFLESSRDLPLSYSPVGLARKSPPGFDVDEQLSTIGSGEAAYRRAIVALKEWKQCELGWVEIFPKHASISPGNDVAVLARHAGLWSLNACRIVYAIGGESDTEFGFAYGTLRHHAEDGEEIFRVSVRPDTGDVAYYIRAVSKPRALLARLGYPLARMLQARFRRDSTEALRRAIAR
jgi:uncharacterized protein (UPF0548 family)